MRAAGQIHLDDGQPQVGDRAGLDEITECCTEPVLGEVLGVDAQRECAADAGEGHDVGQHRRAEMAVRERARTEQAGVGAAPVGEHRSWRREIDLDQVAVQRRTVRPTLCGGDTEHLRRDVGTVDDDTVEQVGQCERRESRATADIEDRSADVERVEPEQCLGEDLGDALRDDVLLVGDEPRLVRRRPAGVQLPAVLRRLQRVRILQPNRLVSHPAS